MSYIIEARNTYCLNYPAINQNPIDFFSHLFFTNGNGIEFVNSNPVEYLSFGRYVPWMDYYKTEKSLDSMREYIEDYILPNQVELDLESESYGRSYQDIWDNEITYLNNICELTIEQMTDSEFWYNCLSTKYKYFPYLSLSNGFFKLQEINETSETMLRDIAISVIMAYIRFFNNIKDNKDQVKTYKPILSIEWNDENIETCYDMVMKDLEMLKIEYIRLVNL